MAELGLIGALIWVCLWRKLFQEPLIGLTANY